MGIANLKTKISVEDYLATEPDSPVKREYVDGEVYAMAGGSDDHNRIAGDLFALLLSRLRNSKCEPFFGDIKLRITRSIYYYPDVLVSCEEDPVDPYFRNQPILIIEVTSPSTERVDRSEKLLHYLQIPSLQEYVVVDQNKMNVDIHRRQENGGWLTYSYNEIDDVVELMSVELSIPLPDIYRRVQFQQDANPDG